MCLNIVRSPPSWFFPWAAAPGARQAAGRRCGTSYCTAARARPGRNGTPFSVGLAGPVRERQGHDLYPLVRKLRHFLAGGGAADAALRRFLVVDLARFLREGRAYVLGLLDDLLHELREDFLADV